MAEDNLSQFKKILSTLPEDKRKHLYDRLHALPASEREGFINSYVKNHKSGSAKKGTAPSKGQPSKNAPAQGKNQTGKKNPSANTQGNKKPSPQNKNQGQKKKPVPAQGQSQRKPVNTQGKAPVKGPSQNNTPKKVQSSGNKSQTKELAKVNKPAAKPVVNKPKKDTPSIFERAQKKIDEKIEQMDIQPEVEEKIDPAERRASSLQSIGIGLLAALLIVGLGYFIYLFNKPSIDKKFNQMFGMPAEETINTNPDDPGIMGSEPQHYPTNTPTPVPATPTPTPVPVKSDHPDLKGKTIIIDPGHQATPNTELETVIEKTSAEKEKATTGAVGVSTGAKEYELTLQYAMVLKEYLEGCGAKVILTRDSNEANISNIERAKIATSNKADCFIRIHADSAPDSNISGVKVYVPETGKYSKTAAKDGKKLAEMVAEEIGSTSLGSVQSKMYTGLNHADSVKSYQLVVGYLSNSKDDALLSDPNTAYKVAVAVSEFLAK